ncbi:hypothetical protein BC830DRAFT_467085 [Chytriomyces sp. MP71]|nr:hypothetical protein BC830DRAFT_467085 [Chytriomyces sp. MP71]
MELRQDFKARIIGEIKLDPTKSSAMSAAAVSKNPNLFQDMNLDVATPTAQPKALIFSPTALPEQWKFKLTLPTGPGIPTEKNDPTFVNFTTCNIAKLRPGFPTFLLESEYAIKEMLPRSFFNILHAHNVQHNFVFNFTNPEHVVFKEMAGLRKTGYFTIKEASSNEVWELHLKQSRERTNFFGYLIRASDLRNFIQQRATSLTVSRKLPLVLDLDDTLVRMIGNEEGRYVPSHLASLVPDRVRALADGRKVVLTERVEEFLNWAQRYYEISVCSVGDQAYVDQVINVLDPTRTIIRGVGYSARAEYMHIQASTMPRRPPKDLDSLFVYPTRSRGGNGDGSYAGPFVEAVIVDDNVHMWPVEQQDSIIVVREQRNAKVWNVQLFPHVQAVLQIIHGEFYKQLDAWDRNAPGSAGPSPCQIYKEYLRNELARRIADPFVASNAIRETSSGSSGHSSGVMPAQAVSVQPNSASAMPMPIAAIVQAASTPVVMAKVMSPMVGALTLPDD